MKKNNRPAASEIPAKPLMVQVCLGTLAGGGLMAVLARLLGFHMLSWGLLLGAFLAPLNLLTLSSMARRFLQADVNKRNIVLWTSNLIRWGSIALAVWVLIQISVYCLLGALLSYTWYLMVLAWAGRMSASKGKPRR